MKNEVKPNHSLSFCSFHSPSRCNENFKVINYMLPKSGLSLTHPKYSFSKSKKHTFIDELRKTIDYIPGAGQYNNENLRKANSSKFALAKKKSFIMEDAESRKNYPSPSQYDNLKFSSKKNKYSFQFR